MSSLLPSESSPCFCSSLPEKLKKSSTCKVSVCVCVCVCARSRAHAWRVCKGLSDLLEVLLPGKPTQKGLRRESFPCVVLVERTVEHSGPQRVPELLCRLPPSAHGRVVEMQGRRLPGNPVISHVTGHVRPKFLFSLRLVTEVSPSVSVQRSGVPPVASRHYSGSYLISADLGGSQTFFALHRPRPSRPPSWGWWR